MHGHDGCSRGTKQTARRAISVWACVGRMRDQEARLLSPASITRGRVSSAFHAARVRITSHHAMARALSVLLLFATFRRSAHSRHHSNVRWTGNIKRQNARQSDKRITINNADKGMGIGGGKAAAEISISLFYRKNLWNNGAKEK